MTERREDIARKLARNLLSSCAAKFVYPEHWPGDPQATINEAITLAAALLRPHVWEWIPVGERLPEKMEEVDVVVWRFSEGELIDQWSQIGWRRPDGLWIDSDDVIENANSFDERRVTYWKGRAALPSAPLSLESSDQK